jgi:hypothetical protein
LQGYNDALPDDLRQELFGLAADIVETHAPPPVTAWRARLCLDWAQSVAAIEGIATEFEGSTLATCAQAGAYTAAGLRLARGRFSLICEQDRPRAPQVRSEPGGSVNRLRRRCPGRADSRT